MKSLHSKLIKSAIILGVFCLFQADSITVFEDVLKNIKNFISIPDKNETLLNQILVSGEMDGFFSAYEVYTIIDTLSRTYKKFITPLTKIGKTYRNKEIKAFRIGNLSDFIRQLNS